MDKPFAITLDVGSSLANRTGSWRTRRPEYVERLPPCNNACPAGANIQRWLYHAEEARYREAWLEIMRNNPSIPEVVVCRCPSTAPGAQATAPAGARITARIISWAAKPRLNGARRWGRGAAPWR